MLLAYTLVAAFAVTALVGCASDETAEGESSSVAASTPITESSESVSAESSVTDESSHLMTPKKATMLPSRPKAILLREAKTNPPNPNHRHPTRNPPNL